MYNIAFAIVLLPLFGALGSFLAESSRRSAQICTVFTFLAAVAAIFLLGWHLGHSRDPDFVNLYTFFKFVPSGGANPTFDSASLAWLWPQFGVHVDPLSLALMVVASVTGWVVQWHALTAVRGEADYRRLFWLSSALISAALGVIVSDSLFQFLLLSGVVSGLLWLLDSHWWHDLSAATASRRTFIVNRIGDGALLLAVIYVFAKFGANAEAQPPTTSQNLTDPFSYSVLAGQVNLAVQHGVPGIGMRGLIALAVMIVIAAGVRLAQFPFHLGLMDTDQAPLPALVLGAVLPPLCGAVLLARMFPLLLAAQYVLGALAIVGGLTALLASAMALLQRDMARLVLALAIAQTGLVAVAFGTGGYSAPLQMIATCTLLTTILILVASNFVRSYRTRDIAEMGGAWRQMRFSSLLLGAWVALVAGLGLGSYNGLASAFRNVAPSAQAAAPGAAVGTGPTVATSVAVVASILAMTSVVLLAAAAARLWVVVCSGSPTKRRGFNVDRVSEVIRPQWRSIAAGLAAVVVLVALGIPAVAVTFSHFVFFGATRQVLSVVGGAAAASAVAGLAGVAAGAWLGMQVRRHEGSTAATRTVTAWGGRLRDLLPRTTEWAAVRGGDFVLRTDAELVDHFFGGIGDGVTLVEHLGERARTRRLPIYVAASVTLTAVIVLVTGLVATGHFPGLAS